MNEKRELLEYLDIAEMKLKAIERDMRNIRAKLQDCEVTRKAEQVSMNSAVSFFEACSAETEKGIFGFKNG